MLDDQDNAVIDQVARVAIEFVHEGEDGDVAQRAHLEELPGLGLDALRAVDDHDGSVGGHERAIGVLGEVLVAGGVEDVDAVAVVRELQHRRGHADAALLLDVHPVRDRMARTRLALDGARRLYATGIEQQLLGEGRLTRIGVRDNGEGAPRGNLI